MQRKASAQWQGGLKDGKGVVSAESGALANTPYTYKMRFEEGEKGTNPEELVGAAHASCFAMALSAKLGEASLTAERISVAATVDMHPVDGKPTVTAVRLHVRAHIPGADRAKFDNAVKETESFCPISRLLNAKITVESELEG